MINSDPSNGVNRTATHVSRQQWPEPFPFLNKKKHEKEERKNMAAAAGRDGTAC
jgi:hypothetical protein